MNMPKCLSAYPEVAALVRGADDLHDKIVVSDMSLREFLAAVLSYMPEWMRLLYRVRAGFVRLLGTRQEEIPEKEDIAPEEVSFTPGERGAFFTILAAKEGEYWLAEARDRMIVGYLGVVVEQLEGGGQRLHFLSGARYLRWTGRIYYNVILPFHHLVINCMAREALGRG